jgi:hypothetical protein
MNEQSGRPPGRPLTEVAADATRALARLKDAIRGAVENEEEAEEELYYVLEAVEEERQARGEAAAIAVMEMEADEYGRSAAGHDQLGSAEKE